MTGGPQLGRSVVCMSVVAKELKGRSNLRVKIENGYLSTDGGIAL